MKFAVVIPAYNEAATIRDVVERALLQCPHVIVVDDGSTDGTAECLGGLAATVLCHHSNQGKGASIWSGIQQALTTGAEAVITLDGDGQHRPEDIPRLIAKATDYPGLIVIGSRMAQWAEFPPRRLFANRVANFGISWAAGYRIEDSQSGMRLYPSTLVQTIDLPRDRAHGFVFESEILIEAARRGVYSVPVPIDAIYSVNARASHFRNVIDVVRIARMVGWKLLSRALYLQGFIQAFLRRARYS